MAIEMDSDTLVSALEMGATLEIDLMTGERKVVFDRDNFDPDEWQMILDEFLGKLTPKSSDPA